MSLVRRNTALHSQGLQIPTLGHTFFACTPRMVHEALTVIMPSMRLMKSLNRNSSSHKSTSYK